MKRLSAIAIGPLNQLQLSSDGLTMVIRIPISFRRRGGRKSVVTPADAAAWSARSRVDNTIVKALVRAYRWRGMLEANLFVSVRELAKAEKINESYLCRVLRLTLLSPALTEAILNGQQPDGLDLKQLLASMPIEWDKQDAAFRRLAVRPVGRRDSLIECYEVNFPRAAVLPLSDAPCGCAVRHQLI